MSRATLNNTKQMNMQKIVQACQESPKTFLEITSMLDANDSDRINNYVMLLRKSGHIVNKGINGKTAYYHALKEFVPKMIADKSGNIETTEQIRTNAIGNVNIFKTPTGYIVLGANVHSPRSNVKTKNYVSGSMLSIVV